MTWYWRQHQSAVTVTRSSFSTGRSRLVHLALGMLLMLTVAAATSRDDQISTVVDVTNYRPHVGFKLSATENVIQRQTYVFPSEYAEIDCDLTLVFSSGLVFGPVNLRLQRDEETSTTR